MKPPDAFVTLESADRAEVWCRRGSVEVVREQVLLPAVGPPPAAADPVPLTGRGGAHAIRWPGLESRLVYRRLLHGGALRALTGDRFMGEPRPFLEVEVSEALRAAGVPTPAVVFAVVRRGPVGIYRGAVATELHEGAVALADRLTELARAGDAQGARALLVAAGSVVRAMHEAGVVHADLNLRNLLVEAAAAGARSALSVIDLDRSSRPVASPSAGARRANLDRMLRSLRKFPEAEALVGALAGAALEEGYAAGS